MRTVDNFVYFHHPGEESVEIGLTRVDFINFQPGTIAAEGLREAAVRGLLEKDPAPKLELVEIQPEVEIGHQELPLVA